MLALVLGLFSFATVHRRSADTYRCVEEAKNVSLKDLGKYLLSKSVALGFLDENARPGSACPNHPWRTWSARKASK
jgi:hypothetical protein